LAETLDKKYLALQIGREALWKIANPGQTALRLVGRRRRSPRQQERTEKGNSSQKAPRFGPGEKAAKK
jgi:hypothetical protein